MLPDDPLKWAVNAFKDGRNDTYARYERYLAGEQPLAFATEKFRSAFGRLFEAFAYNRCGAVVDSHADRLQVAGFGADNDAIAQRAQEQWDDNLMDVQEGHIEADAFGLGQSYLLVEKHPTTGAVYYWVQHPANIRTHFSEDVPNAVDLAVKTWQTEEKHQRLNLYLPGRIEKYISRNRAPSGMPSHPGAFERYESDESPWAFALNVPDVVPIFPFANNGRTNSYGVSELRNVIPLQDALNKGVMDMLVAMEFAAYPQRVMIGVDPQTEDEQAAITRFEAGVSRILTLFSPDAKIGEFSAANIAQYLSVIEFFDRAISRVTRVPLHHLTDIASGTSGRTLRVAESPFTKKIEDRQRAFGVPIASAVSYGLALDNVAIVPGELRVNWEPAAPLSEEDQLDMAVVKDAIGWPFEAILREMGRDTDEIAKIMAEKKTAADEAMREFNRGTSAVPLVAGRIGDDADEEDAA